MLAIIAILAAIVLPGIPRGTSRTRLQAYAIEIANVLRADRDAALWWRRPVSTEIDALDRSVRSGSGGQIVNLPQDVHFEAVLATRCNQRLRGATIDFFASGMSCGGTIRLTHQQVGYDIRVNWLTGGVEIVPADAL